MSRNLTKQRIKAFTLIELLVVVAIIAVLVALLLPALSSAREQARGVQCLSTLRGFGSALQMYGNEFNGYITWDGASCPRKWFIPGDWPRQLAPYMSPEAGTAAVCHNPNFGWGDSDIDARLTRMFRQYFCYSAPQYVINSETFRGGYGWNGCLDGDRWSFGDRKYIPARKVEQINPMAAFLGDGNAILDWGGVTCAILFQDSSSTTEDWHYPIYRHNNAANFVFVDGHGGRLPRTESSKLILEPGSF